MANNRIAVIVSLQAVNQGLNQALQAAQTNIAQLSGQAQTATQTMQAGFATVNAGVGQLSQQVSQAHSHLLAFVGISWAAGQLRELLQLGDAWNMMAARLALATAGQQEFMTAQRELFGIAQRMGVPIAETATLYGKLQQAVRMLGGEQQQALSLTESISQALVLSGASANESQAALLQFGQALSAGVLRGEEFNSVVENSPRLAKALADGLNVPIGRLRRLAEEGRLTADVVVNALMGQKDKLAAEYAQLPATVSQSFQRLSNAFGQWFHQLDQSTGLTQKFSAALTWLAQHLDEVMVWLQRLAEVGLAVLVYRLIPALMTAWQTLTATVLASTGAISAAFVALNVSVGAAIASLGVLNSAFAVLLAAFVGWEIGTWLSAQFATVRKAGVWMVEGVVTGIEYLQYAWEMLLAVFTSDTLEAATARHQARLAQMQQTFAQMYADAQQGSKAAQQAIDQLASANAAMQQRLLAVQQGTQEALGRSVETIHAALEKVKGRIGEVEQAYNKAHQTIKEATGQMANSYRTLTATIELQLAQQLAAVSTHYQQALQALTLSKQSEAQIMARSLQLFVGQIQQQTILQQQATQATLALIDTESRARLLAASREGQTQAERVANVRRVENEILATKRQHLSAALQAYTQHVNALQAEAQRHLADIKRIEEDKKALRQSTEDKIRELQRSAMGNYQAYQDKLSEIAQLQDKARAAIQAGEFDKARDYAKKAQDLATQTASAVKEGDQEVVSQKAAVQRAIEAIQTSEALAIKALEAEGRAHQQAANQAISARDQVQSSLKQTQTQIQEITAQLSQGLTLTINADSTRLNQAIQDLDKSFTEKERLLPIKLDLEKAEKQLQDYEQRLKEGKALPIDADVSQAKQTLQQLNDYAREFMQLELRVVTDKSQAAIALVDNQLKALQRIQTESQHYLSSNVSAVKQDLQSLQGMHTNSTHTIQVQKVEAHAQGGMVGTGARVSTTTHQGGSIRVAPFAQGGRVGEFPRMAGGHVPGVGNQDTVPRTLTAGAFVLRKAAVARYGSALFEQLNKSHPKNHPVAHFAKGGLATGVPKPPGDNSGQRDVLAVFKMIELGLKSMDAYTQQLSMLGGSGINISLNRKTMASYGEQAGRDRQVLTTLSASLLHRPQLTTHEQSQLSQIKQTWQTAMSRALAVGQDLEGELMDYMNQQQTAQSLDIPRAFYQAGGMASSDSVPAMLTPGEFVVKRDVVARYGSEFFNQLNQLRLPSANANTRLAVTLSQVSAMPLGGKLRGYAEGGMVSPISGLANSLQQRQQVLSETLPQSPKTQPPTSMQDLPVRTIRVELVAGNQRVNASVPAQEEGRLLALLKAAQTHTI